MLVNFFNDNFRAHIFFFCCQIFEPFGPVELVQLPCDLETGQCKGFGFIQVCRTRFVKLVGALFLLYSSLILIFLP